MKKVEAKKIIAEALVSALNETIVEEDLTTDHDYQRGVKAGIKARVYREMDPEELKTYSRAFQKGYKRGYHGDWWTRFNNWMTTKLGQLGYSRTRGL